MTEEEIENKVMQDKEMEENVERHKSGDMESSKRKLKKRRNQW